MKRSSVIKSSIVKILIAVLIILGVASLYNLVNDGKIELPPDIEEVSKVDDESNFREIQLQELIKGRTLIEFKKGEYNSSQMLNLAPKIAKEVSKTLTVTDIMSGTIYITVIEELRNGEFQVKIKNRTVNKVEIIKVNLDN